MTEVKQLVDRYFYVDCLASLPDVIVAHRFVRELSRVSSKGGFHLRRWLCNRESLLSEVCESDVSSSVLSIEAFQTVERTLGLRWDAKADEFRFTFVFPDRPIARRGILSSISSLFDPLGLVAPLLLPAKILLQRLCKKQLHWDEKQSDEDSESGRDDELKIPRCVKPADIYDANVGLHIFSDASKAGYGVVGYCRWCVEPDKFTRMLIYAKSIVAPLKS
ncbi:hypothetical protein X801_07522, partial [Opisthorchis viverrini]